MSGLRARRVARTSTVSGVGVALLLAGLVSGPQLSRSAATDHQPVRLVAQPLAAPAVVATTPQPPAPPAPLPPLRQLIRPSVLVTSSDPLTDAVVRRLVQVSGAQASLVVATGEVALGRGRTRALAGDPVKVRVWTPKVTGRVTAVWQRAVAGEALLAHAVAKADGVALGETVDVRGAAAGQSLRAGGLASTELPGIGLVVNDAVGERLGLRPRTGLLLAVRHADPEVTAALVRRELSPGASVEPVLVARRSGSWAPPVLGRVTSPYGMRIHPISGQPQLHEGVDLGAPLGAPVYAMADGQVLYAGPASGFGSEIVLSHAGGVSTVYGHVSRILVTAGRVRAGQVIALVGSEGESTGPHLHAEVLVDDRPVDPVAWLRAHGVRFTG